MFSVIKGGWKSSPGSWFFRVYWRSDKYAFGKGLLDFTHIPGGFWCWRVLGIGIQNGKSRGMHFWKSRYYLLELWGWEIPVWPKI